MSNASENKCVISPNNNDTQSNPQSESITTGKMFYVLKVYLVTRFNFILTKNFDFFFSSDILLQDKSIIQ